MKDEINEMIKTIRENINEDIIVNIDSIAMAYPKSKNSEVKNNLIKTFSNLSLNKENGIEYDNNKGSITFKPYKKIN